jgi:type I restriction enzyme M protein
MTNKSSKDKTTDAAEGDWAHAPTLPEDTLVDFITGAPVRDSPKERVRQRVARALSQEYHIALADMASDFSIRIGARKKALSIAVFEHGGEHVLANLSRAVIVRPEPKVRRGATRLRDYEQAKSELAELEQIMREVDHCRYGLWTNGMEVHYIEKTVTRGGVSFEPVGDWFMADESVGTRGAAPDTQVRSTDPELLRLAFRRCHNFIHGNEGMPKDVAFWQFLYLIFCKMFDEQRSNRTTRRFWAGAKEQFDALGRREIRKRIEALFADVKTQYSIFRGNEEIILSDRALAFIVSELQKYNFTHTDVDVKGAAYQEIVGANLRGDRGQYFTPRGVINLTVAMLHPTGGERILDPACGTGGFLVATLDHMLRKWKKEKEDVDHDKPLTDGELDGIYKRLKTFAEQCVFGVDFDPFLIKASQMNMVMAGDGHGHLYHANSLELPGGYLADVKRVKRDIPFGSIDVITTNPPFGSDIPITDEKILSQYELARIWEQGNDGTFHPTTRLQTSIAPEVLFIERCLQWLRPGGCLGIVLPDGILGNPANEYIRWWIMKNSWLLAVVDLPVEVFIVEANVHILTSVLLLVKKTDGERAENPLEADYPIFMAVAENVGFDRRGNKVYKRRPDGQELLVRVHRREEFRDGDQIVVRSFDRYEPQLDDDLPEIVPAFHKFVKDNAKRAIHLANYASRLL